MYSEFHFEVPPLCTLTKDIGTPKSLVYQWVEKKGNKSKVLQHDTWKKAKGRVFNLIPVASGNPWISSSHAIVFCVWEKYFFRHNSLKAASFPIILLEVYLFLEFHWDVDSCFVESSRLFHANTILLKGIHSVNDTKPPQS